MAGRTIGTGQGRPPGSAAGSARGGGYMLSTDDCHNHGGTWREGELGIVIRDLKRFLASYILYTYDGDGMYFNRVLRKRQRK